MDRPSRFKSLEPKWASVTAQRRLSILGAEFSSVGSIDLHAIVRQVTSPKRNLGGDYHWNARDGITPRRAPLT